MSIVKNVLFCLFLGLFLGSFTFSATAKTIADYENAVLADGPGLYWSFNSQNDVTGYVPEVAGGLPGDALWPLQSPGADHPAGWLAANGFNDGDNILGSAFGVVHGAPYSTYYNPDTSKASPLASWALEFWSRRDLDGNKYLFSAPTGGNNTTIYTGYGGAGVTSVTGNGGSAANFAATDNGWHHYAVIVDAVANTTSTILDGDAPVTVSGKLNPFNWEGSMIWGSNTFGASGNFWWGAVDDFAVYDLTGKTPEQIAALATSLQGRYDLAKVPEPSTLVLLICGTIGFFVSFGKERR